jgi:hypothetical protein
MATRTETELELAQARVAELAAKAAAEAAARAAASSNVRALAVAIHTTLCPRNHALLECMWFVGAGNSNAVANDPDQADWTEPQHLYWLNVTITAVAQARGLGFTVDEPSPAPEPDPAPEQP